MKKLESIVGALFSYASFIKDCSHTIVQDKAIGEPTCKKTRFKEQ